MSCIYIYVKIIYSVYIYILNTHIAARTPEMTSTTSAECGTPHGTGLQYFPSDFESKDSRVPSASRILARPGLGCAENG